MKLYVIDKKIILQLNYRNEFIELLAYEILEKKENVKL